MPFSKVHMFTGFVGKAVVFLVGIEVTKFGGGRL
jgi:hypothetical protein